MSDPRTPQAADDQTAPASRIPGEQAESTSFPHLFSPLRIGPITVKNRIVNAPHQTRYAHDGNYTDRVIAYHRERARGGAAVIVSQATSVVPDYLDLRNVDEGIVDQYRRVVEALHPLGAYYFAELHHPGRQGEFTGSGVPVYHAPSEVPFQSFGVEWRVPHELDGGDIRAIVAAFGAAAGRCRAGGVDGIELHFGHGNLPEQFISPRTNLRTDEWGGSIENRLRFAREVLVAVREAVGRELVVGCRLTGGVLDAGDRTELEVLEIAGRIAAWDLLDYISVTMGHYSDALNVARNMPDMTFEPGLWGRQARGIKNVVDLPVFVVGRINHPQVAEDLLSSRSCDMVVMARALIADPYLPAKARAGRVGDIRPCVAAMTCFHHLERGNPIGCIYNPLAGREEAWSDELAPSVRPRSVLVVGGGPGGLECARVAAQRGHQVTLVERETVLGGQVHVAARAPKRAELRQIVEWLARQCEQTGVEIRLGDEATRPLIAEAEPDAVVVATGSTPGRLPIAADGVPVFDPIEVLRGDAEIGRKVLIADDYGDRQAFDVAHFLAERGHRVELATSLAYPGIAMDSISRRVTYGRLVELGVTFYPLMDVVSAGAGRVTLGHVYAHVERPIDDVDAIVAVRMPRASDGLYRALRADGAEVHLVGDALAPRTIEAAVYDGHRIGREL
jgi:2,4-dienoyl-CoA reductase-like NADH-dependent reductase (Old Yellow Enzyme family)